MDQSRTLARPFRRTQPLRWWGAATILPQPDPEGAAPEGITTMTMMTTKPSNEDPNVSTAQAVRALIVAPQDAARWEKGKGSLDRGCLQREPSLRFTASVPRPTVRINAANGHRSLNRTATGGKSASLRLAPNV